MYRLLHQEMIVLALLSSINAIVLIALPIVEKVDVQMAIVLAGIYMVVNFAALQFHQVTCLSVACIR